MTGEIHKLVVVISDNETGEPKERWNFDIETDKEMGQMYFVPLLSSTQSFLLIDCFFFDICSGSTKPEKEIVDEIRQIIRQITASVTFLPLLEGPCSFDLLVYTSKTIEVPSKWEETEPKYITNAEEVRLRSFTTKVLLVSPLLSLSHSILPIIDLYVLFILFDFVNNVTCISLSY
jgi:mitotic spindle assembly checkpoint protein MAD2